MPSLRRLAIRTRYRLPVLNAERAPMNAQRRFVLVTAVLVLVLAASAGSAFALPGASGVLTGHITEGAGPTPLEGIVVEVSDTLLTSTIAVVTDAGGHYTVSGVPDGLYDIVAKDPAGAHFWSAVTPATVSGGGTVTKNLAMDIAGYISGTVTGGSGALPGAKVFLFDTLGFPKITSPDPGPTVTDDAGGFLIPQVVDPLGVAQSTLAYRRVLQPEGRCGGRRSRRDGPGNRTPERGLLALAAHHDRLAGGAAGEQHDELHLLLQVLSAPLRRHPGRLV
jgi:hypothetical protein